MFIHNYLHDVMAGWFILALLQILMGWRSHRKIHLSISFTVLSIAAFYWEYIAPFYTESVTDPLDLVAYMSGGGFYVLVYKLLRKGA